MSASRLLTGGSIVMMIVGGALLGESPATAQCRWMGTSPLCNGECGAGESEITREGADPGFVDLSSGARLVFGSDCFTGTKALCCKTPTATCRWKGTAPFCAGKCTGSEKQASPPEGFTSGASCLTGSKVYCCTPRPVGTGIAAQGLSTCPIDRALCAGTCCPKDEGCCGTACCPAVKSVGRVNTSSAPPRPICEAARDARARNSPAAPNLEAQCHASGQEGYYRLQMKSGGKYLDAVNCSEKVALNGGSAYAGGVCQLWRMVPAGGGWSRLQLKEGGKYLDSANCSDNVALNAASTYADGACQLWRLVPAGGGWSRLEVKQGGKFLEAAFCSDKVGLNTVSTYAQGDCQLWRLVGAGS